MIADPLTQRHRAQQIVVQQTTSRQVAAAWPALQWDDLDGTFPALAAAVAPIVVANRRTSTGLAIGYARALRAKHVRGRFAAVTPGPLDRDQFAASLHSTSVAPLKAAAGRGILAEAALADALTLVAGAMSRLALDGGRFTVTQTAIADPAARGWQRVGVGQCDFCQMLLNRGAVYTEATADFAAHDHCACSAEPVYGH